MARVDPMTGKPRGFLRLGTHPRLDSVLFTIDLRDPVWQVRRLVCGYICGRVGIYCGCAWGAGGAAGRRWPE